MQTKSARPDYGIDAPGLVLRFVLIGVAGIAVALISRFLLADHLPPRLPAVLARMGLITAGWCLATAAVMVWGSKVIKLGLRERLLDGLQLRGDERVLDVGCGRGLLLNAAARRLPRGRAVGVDLWQREDQSGNAPETTLANARAEDVEARVELHTGDMRQLPFEAASFDAIVSSWAVHNIYDEAGRTQALQEIVRVLKPGGRLAMIDIQHTHQYEHVLKEAGMAEVKRSGPNFLFVIPSHTVTARKPA